MYEESETENQYYDFKNFKSFQWCMIINKIKTTLVRK